MNVEKFNLKDYLVGEKIEKFSNGYITFAKKISTNKIFSLKILKKSTILKGKPAEHIKNEYTNLLQIYHPFIIELKGINTTDPYNLYLFFEYIIGKPLRFYIKINEKLTLEYARFYLASLITILDYLHKKSIILRSLKPENILITSNGYIKLIGFSFTKKLEKDLTYTMVGLPEYYSPEMINQTGHNKCTDFWQLGILLYEMLVGCTPFIDSNPINLYNKIKKGKIKFPKDMNKNAKMIIKHLLNVDMNKRLGCTKRGIFEIIKDPFFKGFDWERLLHRTLEPPFIPKINRENYIFNTKILEDDDQVDKGIAIPKEKDIFYNW